MNYSFVETGSMSSGDTQPVSFAFRKRDEVFVMVDGVDVPSNLYEWVNDGLIRALNGFPTGTVTRIERRTPVAGYESSQSGSSVYDWQGANANFRQSLFVIQEYADKEARRNEQIEEVTQYVEDMEEAVQAAAQSAANANLAASSAAANAAEAVSDVLHQAQAAAEAAEEAAARADQFDPLNFYTRAQADGTFLTSLSAQSDFYTKSQIISGYYTKTAIDTALGQRDTAIGGKVAKSGDTLTGDLTFNKNYPSVRFLYPGVRDVALQIREEGGFHIWDNSAGNRRFTVYNDGSVWTSQFGDLNSRIEARAAAHADSRAWAVANDRVANLNSRWVSRGEFNLSYNIWREAPAGSAVTGFYIESNNWMKHFCYRYFQLFDPVRGWITAHNA